ncbi:DUF4166 domain-containing protein [Caenimonas aquaedulcis]|uniref:DUF4166 domain-containing protein n=1 Tax=Caenimonas aquaedulcis TaxID=2793270 RepID=A0A931H601_9BURK|nr:DUF4166 domain-containing protein [Caenimonas aquaedulcis]
MSEPSLYERVMGDSYQRLASPVRAFHRLSGRHVLTGEVRTHAPQTWLARLLAWGLGTPTTDGGGAIRFELDATPRAETWTRHFPAKTMTSTLRASGNSVVEHLGVSRLTFHLHEQDTRLEMRLVRLRFLGLPCPRWLMPDIVAVESGEGSRFQFEVQARVPIAGLVARYAGHLMLPAELTAETPAAPHHSHPPAQAYAPHSSATTPSRSSRPAS